MWSLNVILERVDIVETVDKLGGRSVAEALGAPKLAEVVGDVLQEDSDDEHAEQGRHSNVYAAQAQQQRRQALHHQPT